MPARGTGAAAKVANPVDRLHQYPRVPGQLLEYSFPSAASQQSHAVARPHRASGECLEFAAHRVDPGGRQSQVIDDHNHVTPDLVRHQIQPGMTRLDAKFMAAQKAWGGQVVQYCTMNEQPH